MEQVLSAGVLENKTATELVDLYNELTGEKVERFSSKAVGVQRVLKALASRQTPAGHASSPPPAATATPPQPVAPGKSQTQAPPQKAPSSNKGGRKRKPFNCAPKGFLRPNRPGTGRAKALELLRVGATLKQVQAVTGWSEDAAVEGIRLINSHLGWGLREDSQGVVTAYHGAAT